MNKRKNYSIVACGSNAATIGEFANISVLGVSVTDSTATGTSSISLDLSNLGSNYITIEYSGVNGY